MWYSTSNEISWTYFYMLITISIAVAIVFFVLFVLAVRKGQYDDSYTPSVRMLFDDELIKNPEEIKKETTEESNTNTNQQS